MVDECGALVDGDAILAIAARELAEQGRLAHRTLVTTHMSNIGLELAMRDLGITVLRTQVGDRYVLEEMQRGGYNLGGEQSGTRAVPRPHHHRRRHHHGARHPRR